MTTTHRFTARMLASATAVSLSLALPACEVPSRDRWVTTENANVDIDWDEVGEAYKAAEGPEDLERRVNEIYTGDEVISVAVQDLDEKTQVVTGFFDKDEDGKVADAEKIFTIQRDVTGPDQGQYQIAGYGPYHGYHSPMWDIASGMLLGSMMMSVFSPGYRPLYSTPYTTPVSRRGQLVTQRNSWRQSNPEAFNKRASKSGRSYGAKGGGFGGGKPSPSPRMPSRGGGRFGLRRAPAHAPTRLLA